uniref:Uncharacterized protein n=1 Tax=Arundo donax TaxID=35708 RepID=A0A0A9H4Q5_ARUDO
MVYFVSKSSFFRCESIIGSKTFFSLHQV